MQADAPWVPPKLAARLVVGARVRVRISPENIVCPEIREYDGREGVIESLLGAGSSFFAIVRFPGTDWSGTLPVHAAELEPLDDEGA